MQRLIEGVHKFRHEEFGQYRALFQRLSEKGQNPHTLFITCADSRVLAELITQSKPGDLFVVKNVGNIIPPSVLVSDTNSTAAAIEFATGVLGVQDIVVCGHTQCGAMYALIDGSPEDHTLPHLNQWLSLAKPVRDTLKQHYAHLTDREERATLAAEENVRLGLKNLHTYPAVAERLAEGTLRLHGWIFQIATAKLFAYEPKSGQFAPINPD
jgi:carbonic anhydrase